MGGPGSGRKKGDSGSGGKSQAAAMKRVAIKRQLRGEGKGDLINKKNTGNLRKLRAARKGK